MTFASKLQSYLRSCFPVLPRPKEEVDARLNDDYRGLGIAVNIAKLPELVEQRLSGRLRVTIGDVGHGRPGRRRNTHSRDIQSDRDSNPGRGLGNAR
jgi:hypothetical protein